MTTIATNPGNLNALRSARMGSWNRWTRRRVLDRLQALEGGRLHLVEGGERLGFGSADAADAADAVEAEVVIRDPRFYSAVAFGGSLGAAEAYVDGRWDSEDLTAVIRLMARNRRAAARCALPSVAALTASMARASELTPLHLEEIGLHYAETLRRWRERFEARWEQIATGGYSERFRRLWRYYLSYCEGGFRERVIGNVQMILAGPAFRGDSVRGVLG